MPASLSRDDRLRIIEFVCAFAWADLEVGDAERAFIFRLLERMGLDDDKGQVEAWLRHPPPAEDVDPTRVPAAHRELLLGVARELVHADGHLEPEEQEMFQLMEQLLVECSAP